MVDMTSQEIIDQYVRDVNKRARRVVGPVEITNVGLGEIPDCATFVNWEDSPKNDIIAVHREGATAKYRDEGCAAYKLIRGLEKWFDKLPKNMDVLYWRVKPQVDCMRDFDKWYPLYRGYVRFAYI